MASVRLDNVCKVFPNGTRALPGLSLELPDGDLAVLVGPSGCGKTTALRIIAGLERATAGNIVIGDRLVNDLPPGERDIAMVFQNYALYPHMTVHANMAFGLRARGVDRARTDKRVREIAALLGLEELLGRKPRALSGGQRQRVAMGRAIVREPQVFLMDEPLSNLDAQLRVQMRAEIVNVQRELATTTAYVTHDQIEAMTMGDQVAVILAGELQQFAPPKRIYDEPANVFVARFIGNPPMNLMAARVDRTADGVVCHFGEVALGPQDLERYPALGDFVGRTIVVGMRPETLHPALSDNARDVLRARVWLAEQLGWELIVHADVQNAEAQTPPILESATEGANGGPAAGEARLVARFESQWRVEAGAQIGIQIDPRALHFFDPETGAAICHGRLENRAPALGITSSGNSVAS